MGWGGFVGRLQDKWDDIGYDPINGMILNRNSVEIRPSNKREEFGAPIYHKQFNLVQDQIDPELIIICSSIITLCKTQKVALGDLIDVYDGEPRSKSFGFWFKKADISIKKKEQDTLNVLKQYNQAPIIEKNEDTDNISVRSRFLEYIVVHIVNEELKYQTADATELINIEDDAAKLISHVEKSSVEPMRKNDVFTSYLKSRLNMTVRRDHCCKDCGGELFLGIPYCLNCNTLVVG